MFKKIKIYFKNRRRSRFPEWGIRWNAALENLWQTFYTMPVCEESLKWMERNSKRLMNLGEKKADEEKCYRTEQLKK